VFRGLEVLTAAPDYPARLVSIVDVTEDVSVAEFQRLAHEAIDDVLAAGRTPVVVGGSGLYLRAALTGLELPPPPAEGARERWETVYDEDPAEAHALLTELDAAAAARVHANDRRRVVRALELAEMGASLAGDALWSAEPRHRTFLFGLDVPDHVLESRIEARAREMLEHGVVGEAQRALAAGPSTTARKVMGLVDFAELPPAKAVDALVANNRRLARYQRKWLRRLPGVIRLDANRPPAEVASEIVARAKLTA